MCFSFFRGHSIRDLTLSHWVTFLSAAFFATLTVTPNSYSFAAITLSLLAIVMVAKTWRVYLANSDIRLITFALCGYFLAYALEMVVYQQPFSTIDMPSRALLAALALGLLYRYPPRLNTIMVAIAVGSIASGIIAIYFSFGLDKRAFSDYGYMVIQIGGICAWLGTLSLISFLHYVHEKKSHYAIICGIGAAFALLATLLSGARGAWLFTPFIMVLSLWAYRHCLNKKKLMIALCAIVAISFMAYPQIKTRVDLVIQDLVLYANNNANTSSGYRLEMWKSALHTGIEHPLFGVGHDGVPAEKQTQIEQGLVTRGVLNFKRAHNQYLEELQTKGLIGVVALFALFLVPLRFFYRKLKVGCQLESSQLKAVSMMGCMHILMVMGFSLTQHYLAHHSGILVFSFGLVILSALAIRLEEKSQLNKQEAL